MPAGDDADPLIFAALGGMMRRGDEPGPNKPQFELRRLTPPVVTDEYN